jgi:hypothetical protein
MVDCEYVMLREQAYDPNIKGLDVLSQIMIRCASLSIRMLRRRRTKLRLELPRFFQALYGV